MSITDAGFTGVAYVSADERYPEVLVYTPKASGDDEAFIESGAVFLTEWAKASALDEILKVEQIRENYRTATVAKLITVIYQLPFLQHRKAMCILVVQLLQ